MSKGVEFFFNERGDGERVCPPFNYSGTLVLGRLKPSGFDGAIAAVMHDYYSVSAEQQRQMALNTIALCEMKYAEQEIKNEMDQ